MKEQSLCGSEALRRYWYAVATDADVGETPFRAGLLGDQFVIWRDPKGMLVAAADVCPHRQAPLSNGTVSDGVLRCGYHGWSFGDAGRCVLIPSSGPDATVPPRAHLKTLPVESRYGLVWLCPGEPLSGIPPVWEEDDESYRRINTGMQTWNCSVTRMVDNFLDYSHFAFVHSGSIGEGLDPRVGPMHLEEFEGGFIGYTFEHAFKPEREGLAVSDDPAVMRTSTSFALPFFIRGSMTWPSGLRQALVLVCTPVDETHSTFTFVLWRNEHSASADDLINFELNIDDEDRRMVESLDGPLPLDPVTLVNVQSDKASVEWRRQLAAVIAAT